MGVKPDLLLSLEDQVVSSQEANLEKMSGPQASASGESAEGLEDQKEERKDLAPKSFGEVRNLSSLVVTFPTEEKEEEGSQVPYLGYGISLSLSLSL